MSADSAPLAPSDAVEAHLRNIAENLQLIADLGYGDVTLAVPEGADRLKVVADARPNTAVAPLSASRVGKSIDSDKEPEALEALATGQVERATATRTARGIKYSTEAFPIGQNRPYAVVVRHLAEQVSEAPGAMETAFMDAATELLLVLATGPLLGVRDGALFSTHRTAGDGVLRIDAEGRVSYASPNAVNILRLAGHEGPVTGVAAPELPGGGYAIAPVLGAKGAIALETEVADRSLYYRSIALRVGSLVLVEDVTETRRREAELKVKEATIREVHHRVKNNLQTIASLLRIQARRSGSEEARHALAEATDRVASMAVVHDLLAGSDEERVDLAQASRTVVELVRQGLVGESTSTSVSVEGDSGQVDAHMATSLVLAIAELVHNAMEHGVDGMPDGQIAVQFRRVPGELVVVVRDNGKGLPADFDARRSANLGLEIVHTLVEDDLRGNLAFTGGRGATVTMRIPVADDE